MSNYITYEERLEIENHLFSKNSFGGIAKILGKDRSTISRDVRKHSVIERTGYGTNGYNACVHRDTCTKVHVCKSQCRKTSVKYCKQCNCCNDNCPDFEEQIGFLYELIRTLLYSKTPIIAISFIVNIVNF